MESHGSDGDVLASNDDRQSDQKQKIIDSTSHRPICASRRLCARSLPAAYTAVVRGKNDAVGVALVEAYVIE